MRNLKKILSLVLALMMVLSIMVTASAAYDDADQIADKHVQAVEVMSALEILLGKGDNFDPTGNLKRSEAATMIAKAALGVDVAAPLSEKAATQFTDVPASHWASGFVAWATGEKIINGRNATTFDPDGLVTGYEFAKMLLVAVGLSDGYSGNTWYLDVATDAKDARISWTGLVMSEELTREQAAQMALNALKANLTPGTYTVYAENAAGRQTKVGEYATMVDATMYTMLLNNNRTTEQQDKTNAAYVLYVVEETPGENALENVHGVIYGTAYDVQGRPYTTYVDAATGGYYFDQSYAINPVHVVENKVVSYQEIFNTLTPYNHYVNLDVYLHGAAVDPTNAYEINIERGDDANLTTGMGGNGVTLEFYADTTYGGYYTVVATYEYFAKVNGIFENKAIGRKYAEVYIPSLGYSIDDYYYDTNAKKGDLLIVELGMATTPVSPLTEVQIIASAELAVPTTGVATWMNDDYTTVNGTTYAYSESALAIDKVTTAQIAKKSELSLYTDKFGNILTVIGPDSYAVPTYAVVTDTQDGYTGNVLFGQAKNYAYLLNAEGKFDTVEYGQVDGDATLTDPAGTVVNYKLAQYVVGANGKYTLDIDPTLGFNGGSITINTNVPYIASGVTANNNTIFVVHTVNTSGKDVYTVYNGIANVPNLTATSYMGANVDATDVRNPNGGYVQVMWLFNASVTPSANVSNLIYVSPASAELEYSYDLKSYYKYDAIVNGEVGTLILDASAYADVNGGWYNSFIVNDKGVITDLTDSMTTPYANVDNATGINVAKAGNVVNVGGVDYYYTVDTVVYVDTGLGITAMTFADYVSTFLNPATLADANDNFSVLTVNNVLVALVVRPVPGV